MTLYQVLCIIGLPSLFGLIYTTIKEKVQNKNLKKELLEERKNNESYVIKKAMQAILRDRLFQMSEFYFSKKYAPTYAKDNFENMYKWYHQLGKNGVMDSTYERFMDLPSEPEE